MRLGSGHEPRTVVPRTGAVPRCGCSRHVPCADHFPSQLNNAILTDVPIDSYEANLSRHAELSIQPLLLLISTVVGSEVY